MEIKVDQEVIEKHKKEIKDFLNAKIKEIFDETGYLPKQIDWATETMEVMVRRSDSAERDRKFLNVEVTDVYINLVEFYQRKKDN